jgi:hypothetical protein
MALEPNSSTLSQQRHCPKQRFPLNSLLNSVKSLNFLVSTQCVCFRIDMKHFKTIYKSKHFFSCLAETTSRKKEKKNTQPRKCSVSVLQSSQLLPNHIQVKPTLAPLNFLLTSPFSVPIRIKEPLISKTRTKEFLLSVLTLFANLESCLAKTLVTSEKTLIILIFCKRKARISAFARIN